MSTVSTFRHAPGLHVREHTSFLAAAEKRLLVWIARRLPQRITSDHLSLLGLASMAGAAVFATAIGTTGWAAACVIGCLIANWFGDSLDGTLARVRGVERPRFGYYVDHVIDLAGVTFLLAGLGNSGVMDPLIAATVLAAYLLVSAETYLATHTAGVFRMSFLGFGPSELRILLAIGIVKASWSPWVAVGALSPVRLFDIAGVIAAAGLVIGFVLSAIRNTRALHQAETVTFSNRQAA